MIKFEWDENKNILNIKKHGVDFVEASSVFFDDDALLIIDDRHSENEDRFVLIGLSQKSRILIVCHCYRKYENDIETIRIISSRKATKNEVKQYEDKK